MEGYHNSIFVQEIIGEILADIKGGDFWFLDCTLGDGGHSLQVLKNGGKVVGLDVDPQALSRAEGRFKLEGIDPSNYRLIQGNFRDLKNLILAQADTASIRFKAILFDLGVSTLQLMDPERGFSFSKEGPLDMRMDPTLQVKALDLIKALQKGELYELFTRLGEEERAKRLSDAVVSSSGIINTTTDLARVVERAVGRGGKIHPATKIFQALRIAVNDELNAMVEGFDQSLEVLDRNGKVLVISFHSLEDRIVKNTFKDWEAGGRGEIVTKKPLVPTKEEVWANHRSRSAKLRIFKYDNNKTV